MGKFTIEFNDNPLDVVAKIDDELKKLGLVISEVYGDGYHMQYEIRKIQNTETPVNKNTLSEKELWSLIEKANWKSDHDYDRIQKEFEQLPEDVYEQLSEFISLKVKALADKYHDDWLGDPGIDCGDDSWSDLRADVVGRGEDFYNSISVEKLMEMASNYDYEESFLYTCK